MSPFELATAIDEGRELHKTHDTLLAQLVAKNFTATAVISALQSARMTEAWTANGVDQLVEVTLFVCNYPVRAVIHHLRRAGTIETYTTKDPNVTREYDKLIEAFSPYRKYFSYFTGLEALARNNPGLRKKITDILKEAHLHSVEEIHEKVMVEYRGLDPVSADGTDGDVFMTETRTVCVATHDDVLIREWECLDYNISSDGAEFLLLQDVQSRRCLQNLQIDHPI